MTTFHVAALWRYPVKTLAGEQLTTAEIGPEGIVGDRRVWVCGPEAVRTSRRHHRLLGLKGTLNADSYPLINGRRWDSPEALALVQDAAGSDAWLEESDGLNRFDVLPLLVATDGAVAALAGMCGDFVRTFSSAAWRGSLNVRGRVRNCSSATSSSGSIRCAAAAR